MLDLSQIEPISRAPYPFNELQEKCLQDLETTDAPQAYECLERVREDGTSGFCCLGRFCVVAEVPRHVSFIGSISYSYSGFNSSFLPDELQSKLKLEPAGEFKLAIVHGGWRFASLAEMNDSGVVSFKEIAAYIRHDPWNVFTDELPSTEAEVS